jgi:hypothetical protein
MFNPIKNFFIHLLEVMQETRAGMRKARHK